MLVDLEVFYLGHLKNLYTIQYNTITSMCGGFAAEHRAYTTTPPAALGNSRTALGSKCEQYHVHS